MRLKELRARRKLRQQDVADAINCSQAVYSRYENGEREPSKDTLNRLADFYGVSVDYIIGRDPVPTSPTTQEATQEQKEQLEIRVLARGGGQLTPEQIKKRNALLRMLMDMDDDELDTAEKLISIVSGKKE